MNKILHKIFLALGLISAPAFAFAATSTTDSASNSVGDILSLENLMLYLGAFIVFLISAAVAWSVRFLVLQSIERARGEYIREATKILVGRVVFLSILLLGFLVALQMVNIDIWTLLAALGLGIGFAFKDIVSSFIAGITILVQDKINIGDLIRVGQKTDNIFGTVVDISTRSTFLKSYDGTQIIVPNSDMVSRPVTCYSINPFRRIDFVIGVDFTTDLEKARVVVLEALKPLSGIEPQPAPSVHITAFADSSISLSVRFWVQSRSKWFETRTQAMTAIKKAFDQNGITIPFPIRTLDTGKLDTSAARQLMDYNRQFVPQEATIHTDEPFN